MPAVTTRNVGPINPGILIAEQIRRAPRPVFALIGAGLSCAVKGPTWDELIDAMGKQLVLQAKSQAKEDVFRSDEFQHSQQQLNRKHAGDIWKAARLHYEEKQGLLNNLFGDLQPGTIHRDLACCGFRGILCLNYDHLLEDAYAQINGRSITPLLPSELERTDFLFGKDFFIAKLHGDYARWNSIVLGEADYAQTTWPKKAIPLISGKTLLVLGISLKDSIVNNFLFDLPLDTHVHVIMPDAEATVYSEWVHSFHKSEIPRHITLHRLEHADLPAFIGALKPSIPADAHIDCSWSELPPSGTAAVDFGQAESELRNFLQSDLRLAHVESQPGCGLSSFLAQVLAERVRSREALVVRMEAKEWLCWDKYVLQMLAKVNGLLGKYSELRGQIAPSTDSPEPNTVALALGALDRPVVICIEQSHRLQPDTLNALKHVIAGSQVHVKFILASSRELPTPLHADTMIRLTRPQAATLTALAARQHIASGSVASALEINNRADLNILVLAGALLDKKVIDASLDAAIRDGDLRALCALAVKHMLAAANEDEHLLRALKLCVVLQSPKTPEAVKACLNCTTVVATGLLRTLAQSGLLIECEGQPYYTMSTSIRNALWPCLHLDQKEFEELSKLAGEYLDHACLGEIEDSRFERKEIYKYIPGVAEALQHYAKARDGARYLDLLSQLARPLIQLCHHQLIENWLEMLPADLLAGDGADAKLLWRATALRMQLTVSRGATRDLPAMLTIAEEALQRLATAGEDVASKHAELEWYRGIVADANRDHRNAQKHFGAVAVALPNTVRRIFEAKLRLTQAQMCLGKLAHADRLLQTIRTDLNGKKGDIVDADFLHCESLLACRLSELATLRLELFARKPETHTATKEVLLADALRHADDARRSSEELGETEVRRGRPDKTGVGVAYLCRAKAYLAGRQFEKALAAAKIAAGVLGAYLNSPWWLVLCQDVAARSLALLGDAQSATTELGFARSFWDVSRHKDPLRDCEFKFTEGLIALKQGNHHEATEYFDQSLNFTIDSPCIRAAHLDFLGQALALDQRTARAREIMGSYFDVAIDW